MATEIFNLLGLGAKSGIDSHRHPKERRRLRNKKKEQCPRRNPRHAYHTDISKTSCYNEDLQIKKKRNVLTLVDERVFPLGCRLRAMAATSLIS